jgi:nitrite reductase/ring-hydroxylating ferredoxin subunit
MKDDTWRTAEPSPLERASGRQDWRTWPRYEAAATGFRNYWYPVMWSRDLRRPTQVTLLGNRIMLHRSQGTVYALHDRCPHRGVPLSYGTEEFPGTISCPYHGWTYDLASGNLCAVITDGPDSPLCGKVRVPTYPVTERFGLIWVFVGDQEPPPLEADLPEELVDHQPTLVSGRINPGREGNWRLAAENGFDEGHAKYLHRNAPWVAFRQMPVWAKTRVMRDETGVWLTRVPEETYWTEHFPGLGEWSMKRWWKRRNGLADILPWHYRDPVIESLRLPGRVAIRMPGLLRVAYDNFLHYEWYVPEDENHHRYVQLGVSFAKGVRAADFWLRYWLVIRPFFHGHFTGQDSWMVGLMVTPPERLYRPDSSVTEWRRLCEQEPRNQTDRKEPEPTDHGGGES